MAIETPSFLRKTFYIKPQLQIKYLLTSLLLTLLSAGVVYVTLNYILFTSDRLSEISTFEIESFQRTFRYAFVWIILILMVTFSIFNLLRFHRLAGPIYVIEKMVHTMADGDLTQDFQLRKGDELKDLVVEISSMKNQLKDFVLSDRQKCKEIEQHLAKISGLAPNPGHQEAIQKEIRSIQEKLSAITSQFKI